MRFHSCHILLAAVSLLWAPAAGDTEIVNFAPELCDNVEHSHYASSWPILHTTASEILEIAPAPRQLANLGRCNFTTHECPHERWLILDATSGGMHTLRLSYPATSSVSFNIEIFSHSALASYVAPTHPNAASSRTWQSYARITSRREGVLSRPMHYVEPPTVKFHVSFERLILGAVPPSMLPVILAAVLVLALAGYAMPRLLAAFETLAHEARQDVARKSQ